MTIKMIHEICQEYFSKEPDSIKRFETGLANYVYEVTYGSDKYVVRVSGLDTADKDPLYWMNVMSGLDLPIPKILKKGIKDGKAYTILTHLEGVDLGYVYKDLSDDEKKDIAKKLIEIQSKVATLPRAKGYGFLSSYDDETVMNSWKDVIVGNLEDAQEAIMSTKIFSSDNISFVKEMLDKHDFYLASVEPIAFLDDVTTKNVLIQDGKLTGIIDLDWLCFGDSLYFIALTNMALLNSDRDTKYIEYLLEEVLATDYEREIVKLYTLIFCFIFMSEKGKAFNKDVAPAVDPVEISRLNRIFNQLYNELSSKAALE